MKKFIAMLLLVAVLASCTAAFAADEYVKFKNSAYVFKKASSSSRTNVIIRRKSVAKKLDEKSNWVKIKYGDNEGWVRSKYVDEDSSATKEDITYSGGGSKKSKETSSSGSTTYKSAKTTGKVNLRKGASLSSGVIKTVKKGTKVTLTQKTQEDSRGVTFYECKVDGKTGWISEKFLGDFEK